VHWHGETDAPSMVPYPTAVPVTTVAAAPKAPKVPRTSRLIARDAVMKYEI
jgi:hypothetical protein